MLRPCRVERLATGEFPRVENAVIARDGFLGTAETPQLQVRNIRTATVGNFPTITSGHGG
jgi:hypothetical protein